MEIRAARPADAPGIADLLGQLGYPSTREQIVARMANMAADSGAHILVADDRAMVIGLTTLQIG